MSAMRTVSTAPLDRLAGSLLSTVQLEWFTRDGMLSWSITFPTALARRADSTLGRSGHFCAENRSRCWCKNNPDNRVRASVTSVSQVLGYFNEKLMFRYVYWWRCNLDSCFSTRGDKWTNVHSFDGPPVVVSHSVIRVLFWTQSAPM